MDINFIIEVLPLFQKALFITLKLACIGIFFSIVIGLICNLLLAKENIFLSSLVNAYIELSRNTPLLIQLFFLYYGLPKFGIKLDEQVCAIIGLSFLGGSYMSEALRAGIEAVHKNQIEAGQSLGMNRVQLFRFVIMPQALSVSIPLLAANGVFLVKETSVVGIIAVKELVSLSKTLIGVYYMTYETMFMLVFFYLIILLPLSLILSVVERKMRYAEHGN